MMSVVASDHLSTPLATLSFGWEDEAFYRRWASFGLSKADLHELKGPALVRLAPQSEYAPVVLRHFEVLLQDKQYVARIVRHYQQFRGAIEAGTRKQPPPALMEARPARNAACPCGSGKKYKKCCMGSATTPEAS
jgi:hypothetical protein